MIYIFIFIIKLYYDLKWSPVKGFSVKERLQRRLGVLGRNPPITVKYPSNGVRASLSGYSRSVTMTGWCSEGLGHSVTDRLLRNHSTPVVESNLAETTPLPVS